MLNVIKKLKEQRFSLIEICDILKNQDSNKTLEIVLKLEEHLESIEKDILELQSSVNKDQDEQAKILSRSVLARVVNTLSTLTIILGETPFIG